MMNSYYQPQQMSSIYIEIVTVKILKELFAPFIHYVFPLKEKKTETWKLSVRTVYSNSSF